jgi:hypothetical protein
MRRLWVALPVGLLAVSICLGLLTKAGMSAPKQRGQQKDSGPGPVLKPDKIITATLPRHLVTLRVRLGSKPNPQAQAAKAGQPATPRAPTVWDGKLSATQATVRSVRLWQDDPRDTVEGQHWALSTRHNTPWSTEERKRGHQALPVTDAALVIELADAAADAALSFDTKQGSFLVRLQDVPLGTWRNYLGNLAQVARVPNSTTMLSAPTEDDYPSAAVAPDGKLYVAYVAFTHGKDFRKDGPLDEEPKSLDYLAESAGGDQVLLLRLDGDHWTGPLPVTPPGQDVFRTATAVDGAGRVWVFWPAKTSGGWQLFARSLSGDAWSKTLPLTADAGPHAFPAAATDSSGRVWVTWQAFRGRRSSILAARQEGDGFAPPITVAETGANQWMPAIACSRDGQVAIAWDTYAKGDYDVYCRIWSEGKLGPPIPVATSLEAQMRASLTYDHSGRLWIAYETAPEKWGKDWGALKKEGVPLYGQRRSVEVRVWADGKLWQPAEEAAAGFALWKNAKQPAARRGGTLAAPRLTTDASGRVWLAARSSALGARTNVGSVWYEHFIFYEGSHWSSQFVCPGTDNILDNNPALVPLASGEVVVIASSDGRAATAGQLPGWFMKELRRSGEQINRKQRPAQWPDPVNNELTMAEFGPVSAAAPAACVLTPLAAAVTAGTAAPEAKKEAADVARMRSARATVGGRSLQPVRGEFHRHTELSQDGGGDGMLLDMWRYALDAAALDWIGNGDHDNGSGREYSWWITQKTTDLFQVPGAFRPVYSYERSVNYPDGHRNVVFARRGVRTLPRLSGGLGVGMDNRPPETPRPHSPDTQLLYRYLAQFDGICASHTSGTDMGTDWRDNNPQVEPIVEIYQGCRQSYEMPGAPRSNTEADSIGGWRPLGFVSLALAKGYRLGFQASSDHTSTHISFCICWVAEPTPAGVLAAMKARHVYGATDNILADVQCAGHFMGDEFTLSGKPTFHVRLTGTGPLAKVHLIKDGKYAHTAQPHKQTVELEWTDFDVRPGTTSYYYVRGEQEDGELVWVSPMWVTFKP